MVTNTCSYTASVLLPDPLTPEALEQARRSIVLLTPGQPSGLDREAAIAVLAELQRLQGADRRLSALVKSLRTLLGVAES